jgi:superfamily II DNA or RNA helicase
VPQPPFTAGDVVTVRGNRWNVEEIVGFPDCTLLRLAASRPNGERIECRLLHPFDRPVRHKLPPRIRKVSPRRWMHALRSALADSRTFGQLRAAASASIDVLPFQLEPALAVVRGLASRLLIADEVGLGKTIQAALILAELQQRGWCERAIILTPAGLREQWAEELSRRFQIRAATFDAASLQSLVSTLPAGLNPWAVEPVSITSIDFVKQPEVLRALASLIWDLVIVDEAHQVATAPQRSAAVEQIARRARHVVLLTATPHAGDEAAYVSLCRIGALGNDDPLGLFRRTRADVGQGHTRHVHLLPVRLSDAEMEMHRLLEGYARRVWQMARARNAPELQLVATVLTKRALSSASALALSLTRRLEALAGAPVDPMAQSALPFDSNEDDDLADAAPILASPAFEQPGDERVSLEHILAAATHASRHERKISALRRLLRRVREPLIVFTEYRDTLMRLEEDAVVRSLRRLVLLHGGLSRHERRFAVQAFTSGGADLLLATDAGSEGLNLQSHCRLVVNLELPWNPVRLEQRIGRVDRLGQTRTVHAIHLYAAQTPESRVLAGLVRRVERIRTEADIALEIFNDHVDQDRSASGGTQ